jgi:ribonuclease Z
MTLRLQILGAPGRDNALLVHVDSGQRVDRLLFDCGEGCLAPLPTSEVQGIDHLFFSHLHMDHVAGFDTFFRCNYDRDAKPNVIWGPPETARILHHRLRGYLWNLHHGEPGTWRIQDVHPDYTRTARFELAEAFAVAHDEGARPAEAALLDAGPFTVEAMPLDHRTVSLAYLVREKPRQNVDPARLAARGLRPGPWLQQLKAAAGPDPVLIDGVAHPREELRRQLVVETAGESAAYLTDFLLDETAAARLTPWLHGCGTIVCESQYRHADAELAVRNHHITAVQAAELARRADAGRLILFHVSDRYTGAQWAELLQEAQAVFPRTQFSAHWQVSAAG